MRVSIGRRSEGRCWGRRSMCEGLRWEREFELGTTNCSVRGEDLRDVRNWRKADTAADAGALE